MASTRVGADPAGPRPAGSAAADLLGAAAALRWDRPDLTAELADHVLGVAAAAGDRDRWLAAAGWAVHARSATGDGREIATAVLEGLRRWEAGALAVPAAHRLRVELALVAIGVGRTDRARALLAPVESGAASPVLRADARAVLARCAVRDAPAEVMSQLRHARAAWAEVPEPDASPGLAAVELVAAVAHRLAGRPEAAAAAATAGLNRLRACGRGGTTGTPSAYLSAALTTEWISALLDTGRVDEAQDGCEPMFAWLGEPKRPSRQLARLRLTIARAMAPEVPPAATAAALTKAAEDAAASDAPDLQAVSGSALGTLLRQLGQPDAAGQALEQATAARQRDRERDRRCGALLGALGPTDPASGQPAPPAETAEPVGLAGPAAGSTLSPLRLLTRRERPTGVDVISAHSLGGPEPVAAVGPSAAHRSEIGSAFPRSPGPARFASPDGAGTVRPPAAHRPGRLPTPDAPGPDRRVAVDAQDGAAPPAQVVPVAAQWPWTDLLPDPEATDPELAESHAPAPGAAAPGAVAPDAAAPDAAAPDAAAPDAAAPDAAAPGRSEPGTAGHGSVPAEVAVPDTAGFDAPQGGAPEPSRPRPGDGDHPGPAEQWPPAGAAAAVNGSRPGRAGGPAAVAVVPQTARGPAAATPPTARVPDRSGPVAPGQPNTGNPILGGPLDEELWDSPIGDLLMATFREGREPRPASAATGPAGADRDEGRQPALAPNPWTPPASRAAHQPASTVSHIRHRHRDDPWTTGRWDTTREAASGLGDAGTGADGPARMPAQAARGHSARARADTPGRAAVPLARAAAAPAEATPPPPAAAAQTGPPASRPAAGSARARTLPAAESPGAAPTPTGAPAPEANAPAAPQPGTPQPGTPQPGTPQPGTPQPGTPQPGTPPPTGPLRAVPEPNPRLRAALDDLDRAWSLATGDDAAGAHGAAAAPVPTEPPRDPVVVAPPAGGPARHGAVEDCHIVVDVARDGRRFAGRRPAGVLRAVAERLAGRLPTGARLVLDDRDVLVVQLPDADHVVAAGWLHRTVPGLLDGLVVEHDLARLHLRSVVHGTHGPVGAQLLVRLDQAPPEDAPTGRHGAVGRAPFRPPQRGTGTGTGTGGGRRRRREPGTNSGPMVTPPSPTPPPSPPGGAAAEDPAGTEGMGLADLLAGALAAYRGI